MTELSEKLSGFITRVLLPAAKRFVKPPKGQSAPAPSQLV